MLRVLSIGSCIVAMVLWSSYSSSSWSKDELTVLGQHLFFGKALSSASNISCSSCHMPSRAFTDGYRTSQNAYGDRMSFNAPTLLNLKDNEKFGWLAPGRNITAQIRQPLNSTHPVEIDFHSDIAQAIHVLSKDQLLTNKISKAQLQEVDGKMIESALILYIESLVSRNSEYDQKLTGGEKMSEGEDVFFCQLQCHSCHGGVDFDRPTDHARQAIWNQGAKEWIRIPGLRNVAITKPFFHDGSCTSMREAILKHFSDDGLSLNPEEEPSPNQLVALVGFLESLTDTSFLTSERFQNPYEHH